MCWNIRRSATFQGLSTGSGSDGRRFLTSHKSQRCGRSRITENSGDELLLDNDMDMDGMEDEEEVRRNKIDLPLYQKVSASGSGRITQEIGKVSLLSADEEIRRLAKENGKEDRAAKTSQQRPISVVISIAKHCNWTVECCFSTALIQEKSWPYQAVEKFDYRKGYKFSAYAAWWIRRISQEPLRIRHGHHPCPHAWLRPSTS